MRAQLSTLLICFVALGASTLAQNKPLPPAVASQENPFSTWNKRSYGSVKKMLIAFAEKMPEENYSFKPTNTVRTYGQIVGHVAESQYSFCSLALGEKNPAPEIEKAITSKADLIGALKDAFAYCDKAYDGIDDSSGAQIVKFMGIDTSKLSVLNANLQHMVGHRGNLTTYLRIKNLVPPTSDPEFMKEILKK